MGERAIFPAVDVPPGVVLPAGIGVDEVGGDRQVKYHMAVPADAEALDLSGLLNGNRGERIGKGVVRVVGHILVQAGAEQVLRKPGQLQGLLGGHQGLLLFVIAPGVDIPAAAVAAVVLIEYQVQVPVRLGGVEDALLGRVNGLFPRGILDPGILLGQLFQVLVDGGRRLVQLLPSGGTRVGTSM